MANIKISSKVEQREWEALQAIAIHECLIEKFDGTSGLRDMGYGNR